MAEALDDIHECTVKYIRARPGMYLNCTGVDGLHQLVYLLVDYSLEEAAAGFCESIEVSILGNGSVSVSDDGRGIPVKTLEKVMTRMLAGWHYKSSRLLVTALSEWTEAEVQQDGKVYVQEYERAKAVTAVSLVDVMQGARTGTKVTFRPDPEIFRDAAVDHYILEDRLRELAFLNKGLSIKFIDERTRQKDTFKFDGGLCEFVEYMNRSEGPLHKPFYLDKTVEGVRVQVAIQYTGGEEEKIRCYANNAYNSVGGTHLSGFRTAVARALSAAGSKENLPPIREELHCGMTAVASIQLSEPQFESCHKWRLNNPEVEEIVATVVAEGLANYLKENPADALKIVTKANSEVGG